MVTSLARRISFPLVLSSPHLCFRPAQPLRAASEKTIPDRSVITKILSLYEPFRLCLQPSIYILHGSVPIIASGGRINKRLYPIVYFFYPMFCNLLIPKRRQAKVILPKQKKGREIFRNPLKSPAPRSGRKTNSKSPSNTTICSDA